MKMWDQETMDHLKMHISYPATGDQILATCSAMSHVPEEERKMVEAKLEKSKTYHSADEAMADLEAA